MIQNKPLNCSGYFSKAASLLSALMIAGAVTSSAQTINFAYTGAVQTYTVPMGVSSLSIDAAGAQGWTGTYSGGLGGRTTGTLSVSPGQVLYIYVGGQGSVASQASTPMGGGFNGGGHGQANSYTGYAGGGGGATDLRQNGNALSNRVIVAGGGGGSTGNTSCYGGAGGGLTGGTGGGSYSPGTGGSQTAGGTTGGALGQGGNAATWMTPWNGGGGGGYYGGGVSTAHGPGGGGSSYIGGVTNGSMQQGVRPGHGYLNLTILSGLGVFQTSSITCNGQLTAALSASVTGAPTPHTYTWYPGGSNNASISGLGAGVYTVSAHDGNSVLYTSTYTITQPAALSGITTGTNLTCNGGANGAASISVSGGTMPYTYTWSPAGGNGPVASGLAAGNYTCTVKDANNCSVSRTVTLTQPAPISVLGFATSPVVCSGDQSILIGAGALTYTWSHGVTNGVAFTPVATAVYTVTGTNSNGCIGQAFTTITVNPKPTVSITGTNVICSGSSANLLASGANTYTWSNGANGNAISVSPSSNTNYTVYGTNSAGCVNYAVKTLNVISSTPVVNANATSPAVCIGKPTTLYGSGAVSYTWTGGVSNNTPFTPGATSAYTVTGMNSCGTGMASITITVNPLPVISASSSSAAVCLGNTVTLSGIGGVSYSWSSGVTNNSPFFPVNTANYTVTGTDAKGCQNTAVKGVTVYALPFVSANASSTMICQGSPVTLFGGGALTYVWSGGVTNGIAFNPSQTATYNVTGTDVNGCVGVAAKTVSVVTPPVLVANATSSAVCQGGATSLYGSGAASYTWSGGVSNNVPFVPSASTVFVVTGSNSCGTSTASINIIVNPLPVVTANIASTLICIGSQAVLIGGGASTYTWTGGISNNTPFTPSGTSSYTVTGTNANGCKNSAVKTISVIPLPTISTSVNPALVCAGNTVVLNASGATTYTWSNGVANNTPFTPSVSGTYTVWGADIYGCTSSAVRSVAVNQLPVVVAAASATQVCAGNALVLYGGGAHTYTWAGGYTNMVSFFPSATQTYSVSGTNTLTGCTSTNNANITVNVNPLPVITASSTAQSICQGQSTSVYGIGGNSYTWSGGISNGWSFYPSTTTTYYVTGTNNSTGCSNIAMITITVNPKPVISTTVSSLGVCAGSTVALYGVGADTYTWTGGISNGVPFTPQSNQTYYVNGTNTLTGCQSSNYGSTYVYLNQAPNISISTATNAVCAGNNVSLYVYGATTYTWSNGVMTGMPFAPSVTATYSVSTTHTLTGCSKTATQTIIVYPLPTITVVASKSAVCIGNSVFLTAQGGNSYTWTPGIIYGVPFVPTVTKTYTVNGTSSSTGCKAANPASVTVVVNPLPVVSASISNTVVCFGNTVSVLGSGAGTYTWSGGVNNGVPFTPFMTGSYTVSGTDTITGCQSANSAVVGVTVMALPVVSASISSTEVCEGEQVTLTASGAHIYNWSGNVFNNVPFTASASAVYSVSGTNTLTGCSSANMATQTLTVKKLPVIVIAQTQSVICEGESASLIAQGALTYTWSNGGLTPSVQVTPTVTTIYTLTGMGNGGCVSTASVMQAVDPCTGIKSLVGRPSALAIYPNPNAGHFVILSDHTMELNVFNDLGQLLRTVRVEQGIENQVDVSELTNGVYLLSGVNEQGLIRQKIIITR